MHKKIQEARDLNKVAVFRSYFTVSPTWSDVIELMYKASNSTKETLSDDKRSISGSMLTYNRLDPVIFGALDFSDTGIYNKFLQNEEKITDLFGHSLFECNPKVIANLIGKEEKGYYIHSDNHDVFLWNCEGQVEWRIYKDSLESHIHTDLLNVYYESIVLNPGDAIFCPSGVMHQAVVSEPRASFVFGWRTN
jgi:hypothetical protein